MSWPSSASADGMDEQGPTAGVGASSTSTCIYPHGIGIDVVDTPHYEAAAKPSAHST